MKITQLRITNYRGIEALATKIPPGGLKISGPNGAGKTSVLNAIRACLAGRDIGADAIRLGTDRASIEVDMDDLTVRRLITAKGSKLTVESGADHAAVRAPQAFLNDLLGTAPLDPIDLFAAKPKDRKAMILAALPVRVTPEQVAGWVGSWTLTEQPDYTLHGLEVVDQIRRDFYKRRTEQNAIAKELEKEAVALEAGAPPAVAGAPSVEDADAAHRRASAAAAELQARTRRAAEQNAKTEATRKRAAALREEAVTLEASTPPDPDHLVQYEAAGKEAAAAVLAAGELIADLEARLVEARESESAARTLLANMNTRADQHAAAQATHDGKLASAVRLRQQADDLESAIAATAEQAATEEETAAAEAAIAAAADQLAKARAAALRAEHEKKIADVRTRVTLETNKAGELTGMVERFAKEVPNELLRQANGVPGLALDGDDVFLDSVRLDALSGREQLLFAVQISRRLNARAKILIVDGLERVDPDALPAFIEAATADGYQLLATRVDAGSVVLEAIETGKDES